MLNKGEDEVELCRLSLRREQAHLRDLRRQYNQLVYIPLTPWEYTQRSSDLRQEMVMSQARIKASIDWLKAAGAM